jgi:hypothetical protein
MNLRFAVQEKRVGRGEGFVLAMDDFTRRLIAS